MGDHIAAILQAQGESLIRQLHPWKDDPAALILAAGASNEHSIRPNAHTAFGLATLYRCTGDTDPRGTPTMIGTTASTSSGIPNSDLVCGPFNIGTADPMQYVPNPSAHAASIRFSAASQQSAVTNGPSDLAQITIPTDNVDAVHGDRAHQLDLRLPHFGAGRASRWP